MDACVYIITRSYILGGGYRKIVHEFHETASRSYWLALLPNLPKVMQASPFSGRGITIVHGHRHTWEYAEQAKVFHLSKSHWLVNSSDLLLVTNANGSATAQAVLSAHLAYYPHRSKAVSTPSNRGGFTCGHLDALADLAPLWRDAAYLLFLHPDVLLTRYAVNTIGLLMASYRDAAFFVTRFMDSSIEFDTDFFVVRPPLLQGANPFEGMCSCRPPCGKPRHNPSAKPERQLASTLNASSFKRVEMCARFSFNRMPDALGVLHAHTPEEAAAALVHDQPPSPRPTCDVRVVDSRPPLQSPPLGRRVAFIDLGANCGNSLHAVKQMVPAVATATEVYLWEVSPRIVRVWLEPLASADPRVKVIGRPAAASTRNITYRLDDNEFGLDDAAWKARFPCRQKAGFPHQADLWFNFRAKWHGAGRNYTVATMSFLDWFTGLGFSNDDEVYVKVDIEGSEFEVMESFLAQPEMCKVVWWGIEWHADRAQASGLLDGLTPAGLTGLEYAATIIKKFHVRVKECSEQRSRPIPVVSWK